MNDKLFESILSYSDYDGMAENELVEPLEEDESLNQLFEKIYYECRLKPLLEAIFTAGDVSSYYPLIKKRENPPSNFDTYLVDYSKNYTIDEI
jgi:hypothetical protein